MRKRISLTSEQVMEIIEAHLREEGAELGWLQWIVDGDGVFQGAEVCAT